MMLAQGQEITISPLGNGFLVFLPNDNSREMFAYKDALVSAAKEMTKDKVEELQEENEYHLPVISGVPRIPTIYFFRTFVLVLKFLSDKYIAEQE